MWQWNESILYQDAEYASRGLRGGSFKFSNCYSGCLHASSRNYVNGPTIEVESLGFRVSEVPEPASLAILAFGGIGMLVRRRGLET